MLLFRNIVYRRCRSYISAHGVSLEQAVDYILRELQRLLLKKRDENTISSYRNIFRKSIASRGYGSEIYIGHECSSGVQEPQFSSIQWRQSVYSPPQSGHMALTSNAFSTVSLRASASTLAFISSECSLSHKRRIRLRQQQPAAWHPREEVFSS